jgi:CRISPR-associated endonuclease Cas2
MIGNYLIIYDIKNKDTKYNKIYKQLNKCYSKRVQKSVFLVQEEKKVIFKLIRQITKIIDIENDKLLVIPLCQEDWDGVTMFGVEKKKGVDKKDFIVL